MFVSKEDAYHLFCAVTKDLTDLSESLTRNNNLLVRIASGKLNLSDGDSVSVKRNEL